MEALRRSKASTAQVGVPPRLADSAQAHPVTSVVHPARMKLLPHTRMTPGNARFRNAGWLFHAQPDQPFGQVKNYSLGSAIQFGWNAFVQRRDLSNTQDGPRDNSSECPTQCGAL